MATATQLPFPAYIVQDPSLGSGAANSGWILLPHHNQDNAPEPFPEGHLPGNSRFCHVDKTLPQRES